jgi:hypothetical protein
MDLVNLIAGIPGVGPLLPYLAVAVAVCAALATSLPRPAAGSAWLPVYGAINFVALNFGKAKNACAVVLPVLLGLFLAACTGAQITAATTENAKVLSQIVTVSQAACKIDAQAQPLLVTLGAPVATAILPTAAPIVSGAVALDVSVIHPDIVAACKAVGGVAVAVVPAAT